MITTRLIKQLVVATVTFIAIAVALEMFPTMLAALESLRINPSTGNYTALETVINFFPTMVLLGFIITIALAGFVGIKIIGKQD